MGSVTSDIMMSGYSLPLAIFAAAANAFYAGVGAWLLRYFLGVPVTLSSVRAVIIFALGIVVVANAIAVIPGAIMLHVGFGGRCPRVAS